MGISYAEKALEKTGLDFFKAMNFCPLYFENAIIKVKSETMELLKIAASLLCRRYLFIPFPFVLFFAFPEVDAYEQCL